MLPLVHLPDTPVLLAGRGTALAKRLDLLEAAGMTRLVVHTDAADDALAERLGIRLRRALPDAGEIAAARLVFVAGLDDAGSAWLAGLARAAGIPVNVEDVPELCDLHVPAIVRRGGLVLTVSTGGDAPALAAAIRRWLGDTFGPAWDARLAEIAALRRRLRQDGAPPAEIIRDVGMHLAQAGWEPLTRCRPAAPARDA